MMHQALQGAPPTPGSTPGQGELLGNVFSQGLRLLRLCTPAFPRARGCGTTAASHSKPHSPPGCSKAPRPALKA